MLLQILYVILALLGISFLVFIHELGHYFMARRVGIRVEIFSIGFGKPLIEWERKGVKWRICILPFGGYVKMAGMEKQGPIEPYQIEDGFFGAKPWNRIKVAFMGPLVNIVFAFVAFTLIWASGGREKPFVEFTSHIGWVDPDSGPYKAEIRPGDKIQKINGREFKSFTDFPESSALDNQPLSMSGYEIDYWTGKRTPFTYTFSKSPDQDGVEAGLQIFQMLLPANYMLVHGIPENSPLQGKGIEKGDRIVWVNGELIFSAKQYSDLLQVPSVLLTVDRNGETFLTRIPLLKVSDLRLTENEKEEIDDWRFEAKLGQRVEDLSFIPYNITSDGIVQNPLSYIDHQSKSKLFFEPPERSPASIPLEDGDTIIAVSGKPISSSYELLREVQTPSVLMIVQKGVKRTTLSSKEVDDHFVDSFDMEQMNKITKTIGTDNLLRSSGNLALLPPIVPQISLIPTQDEESAKRLQALKKEKKQATQKEASKEEAKSVDILKDTKDGLGLPLYEKRVTLGVEIAPLLVNYNPPPQVLFTDVFKQIYRTFYALLSGVLSPKHVAGPVGIMQLIHQGWSLGWNEALYWLGMISLNLGILNLLPIPVLDGGHILLTFWEMLTKKPLKAKTMERLILPFVILIIAFFVYLTYNDLSRIFHSFF